MTVAGTIDCLGFTDWTTIYILGPSEFQVNPSLFVLLPMFYTECIYHNSCNDYIGDMMNYQATLFLYCGSTLIFFTVS